MKKYILLPVIAFLPLLAVAQDTAMVAKKSLIQRFEDYQARKARTGELMITPLLGPAYTPEMGFVIAGGVLLSMRTDKSDTALQRTSIPINIGYGTNNVFFLNSKITSFWLHDALRVNVDLNLKRMDDNYFGVGYESARYTPKSDTTTKYRRMWLQAYPRFMWQFRQHFFAGAGFDINYTHGSDACNQVAADPVYSLYNERPFNSGISLLFQYDTRDVAVNAWRGTFIEIYTSFYGNYFGGQNNYQVYSLDARKYFRVAKPGQTIAVQLRGRFGVNNVPYGEMSQLGTPFDLRGYLWGQYRDKSMLFGIVEYRHTFYKRNGKPSIHGLVGWVAAGSVADKPGNMCDWLPNGGIGYRLQVQPRMNVRLDFGIGKGGSRGFYFNFNEAF